MAISCLVWTRVAATAWHYLADLGHPAGTVCTGNMSNSTAKPVMLGEKTDICGNSKLILTLLLFNTPTQCWDYIGVGVGGVSNLTLNVLALLQPLT